MKKEFKIFTVDNFEKEETYLRKMALAGFHFKSYQGFKYCFENGEPQNSYYRIDYHSPEDGDKEEYIQLFKDSGWEIVFSFPILDGEWVYFKKNGDQAGSTEIFTDTSSKVQLFHKIKTKWLRFASLISICILIPSLITSLAFGESISLLIVLPILAGIIFLYGKMVFNLTKKIQELEQG